MQNANNNISWFCVSLTPEQKEFGFDDIIKAEMEEIWIAQGAREGVSVWRKDEDGIRTIFFSPIAASIAQILIYRFNGTPCEQPELDKITFLLGHVFNDLSP